jgi:hypothetical protein
MCRYTSHEQVVSTVSLHVTRAGRIYRVVTRHTSSSCLPCRYTSYEQVVSTVSLHVTRAGLSIVTTHASFDLFLLWCDCARLTPSSSVWNVAIRVQYNLGVFYLHISTMGRDSSISVETRCGLDVPAFDSWWGRDFPHPSRPALVPTQSLIQWVSFSEVNHPFPSSAEFNKE